VATVPRWRRRCETFGRIYREATGAAAEQVDAWLAELETSFRYSQDVFS